MHAPSAYAAEQHAAESRSWFRTDNADTDFTPATQGALDGLLQSFDDWVARHDLPAHDA